MHMALKWGIRAELQLSQYLYNVDYKPGLVTKVLRYCRSCLHLAHASLVVVCVFFLALCPYVFTGIAAHWFNYQQLNNV